MPLAKLTFRPGFNQEVTSYTNEGGWTEGNRVRFREGFPETIGGWARSGDSRFLGICRALINWTSLTGTPLLGIGTHLKYYISRAGELIDITPIRLVTDPGDVTFAATDGSDVIVVTHASHGARLNDFVTFSGASSLGGNITATILNAEHQVFRVVDLNSYEIVVPAQADSADTGNGGASVVGTYQITTGFAISPRGDGWGADAWGAGGWADPADTSLPGERVRIWSHTNYGENLIINPRGGGVYYWDLSAGFLNNRAVEIASLPGADEAPLKSNIVRLSEQDRHVLAFGCTPLFGGDLDPLLIRFSSQENFLDWRPRPTNTAGDLRISSGNQIVAVEQTSQQMLILTESSAHVLQFVGPPFTFGIREVASGISVAGPNSAVAANGVIYWMGLGEFYVYDGAVRQLPCSVKAHVFERTFASELRDIVFAGHNAAFSEVWWFYPCNVSNECTRYVVFNYEQQIWYYGTLPRSAWLDRGVTLTPTAAGLDGYLYSHESGFDDGSTNPPSPLNTFIQSSPVDLGEGDQFMFASRLIPDITFRSSTATPHVTMTLTAQNFPGGTAFGAQPSAVSRTVDVPVERYTEQTYIRLRGRSMTLRVSSNTLGTAWRLGSPRIDIRTDGKR
jgi:hypothetical protein